MAGRVLIVDDEASVRFFERISLEEAGIEVDEAASGPEALDAVAAADTPFAAIVMDFRMPGMTGVETAERMLSAGVTTPIILYTAWADPSVAAVAADLGFTLIDKSDVEQMVAHVGRLATV
ncbi:hypothetical protein DSM112329_01399 [Paraconexibacter sp. AEG42_29]|uniref:Response regulatory domain-containing protein n=1 Tax=Paraconexibacter sp. AEG42_29 TaxID=2997339 RepID=A0AAU7ASD6_9ACTN